MFKNTVTLLVCNIALCMSCFCSFAQGTTEFEIKLPEKRIEGSKYGKFKFLDQRNGTGIMGFVQTGALNRKSVVVEKTPLDQQLSKAFDVLADKTKDTEMLFQLRYCAFSEQTNSMSEYGYFAVRANLYAKKGELYQAILGIDTIIKVSAMDVTNKILRTGSETLIKLIDSGLKSYPTEKTYSFNDISKIDSVEKIGFAAFKAPTLTDGVYASSLSFLLQLPDSKIDSAENGENSVVAYVKNEKGKRRKLKATECYALVYQGNAYLSYLRNFYKLTRENDNLLLSIGLPVGTDPYTGTVDSSTTYGMIGGISGGLIGAAIGSAVDAATNGRSRTITIRLDHVTGKLMIVY